MKPIIATISDKGGRETNQDCVRFSLSDDAVCAVVCDGLGAYTGSELAAVICAESSARAFGKTRPRGDDGEALKSLVKAAHDRIAAYKEACTGVDEICTTVACVIADGAGTAIAHIGDTRIYEVRGGRLRLLTRDHSLARIAVDRGEIRMEDIRKHKDQNKLTRVLGSGYYVAPDCDVLPPLAPGDGLILCTDGVWEYVYDEDMERLFASGTPEETLQAFVRLIDERKPAYNDNYTAAVIKAVEG